MHLNPLSNKVVGVLRFTAASPLHVGAGGFEARREFLRTPAGLLIPSSTWKGALRAVAEKLAPSLPLNPIENLAVSAYRRGDGNSYNLNEIGADYFNAVKRLLAEGGEAPQLALSRDELFNALLDLGYGKEEVERGKADEKWLKGLARDYLALRCPIGRLFGNTVLAGKLRPADTLLQRDLHVRSGAGINRKSGTVQANILYFIEAIPAGAFIELRLVVDGLEPRAADARLLAGILDWVRELGLQLGARKSAGMGDLQLNHAEFYLAELKDDSQGLRLANPIKYGEKMDLRGFTDWLTS